LAPRVPTAAGAAAAATPATATAAAGGSSGACGVRRASVHVGAASRAWGASARQTAPA